MEGEDSREHNSGVNPESSRGGKRQLNTSDPDQNPVYIRDNGFTMSSRYPSRWGVNLNHDYQTSDYKSNCLEMAKTLEFYSRVYGRHFIDTHLDDNPMFNETPSEFIQDFAKRYKIIQHREEKIANTLQLRNFLRSEGQM